MALKAVPRYASGVALTRGTGDWAVVTDAFHPNGEDVVSYPTYRDAYGGWKLAVATAEGED